jgi:hypothetical protein
MFDGSSRSTGLVGANAPVRIVSQMQPDSRELVQEQEDGCYLTRPALGASGIQQVFQLCERGQYMQSYSIRSNTACLERYVRIATTENEEALFSVDNPEIDAH